MLASVLVVEDDPELRGIVVRLLRDEGFAAHGAASAAELLDRVKAAAPDALIVDIGLPDADGRDVCRALRANGLEAPVLFLTARDAVTDRLAGFAAGGDDYLTKPFDLDELVARISALLRRAPVDASLEVGPLRLDPLAPGVWAHGQLLKLTPTEFRLLATMASRRGQIVRRGELLAAAWPQGAIVHANTLDVYVARLRRKLRGVSGAPSIRTGHGTGYFLE